MVTQSVHIFLVCNLYAQCTLPVSEDSGGKRLLPISDELEVCFFLWSGKRVAPAKRKAQLRREAVLM